MTTQNDINIQTKRYAVQWVLDRISDRKAFGEKVQPHEILYDFIFSKNHHDDVRMMLQLSGTFANVNRYDWNILGAIRNVDMQAIIDGTFRVLASKNIKL